MTNEKVNKILNSNLKSSKMTEDLKNWFNSKIDEIVTKVKGDNNSETAVSDVEITIADKEEVMNKLTDFEAKLSEANETISNLTEEGKEYSIKLTYNMKEKEVEIKEEEVKEDMNYVFDRLLNKLKNDI